MENLFDEPTVSYVKARKEISRQGQLFIPGSMILLYNRISSYFLRIDSLLDKGISSIHYAE